MSVDTFLWWSGAFAWLGLGTFGLLVAAEAAIDRIVNSVWTQREFLAFVWDRLKKRGAQ